MRLDKFLCDTAGLTRTEAKNAVKKGQIAVNGQVQKAADFKVKENTDTVTFQGKPLSYAAFHYYMLHKPAGVITATEDKKESTVMDILREEKVKNLFPVGRTASCYRRWRACPQPAFPKEACGQGISG